MGIMNIRYRLAAGLGLVTAASVSASLLHNSGSPPNIELIMPFVLATGLVLGPLAGLVSGALTRALFDFFTAQPGPWTLGMAASYGIVGLAAGMIPLLARRKSFSRIEMAAFAAVLTVLYDILSLVAFSVMFRMPMLAALGPQVPFTINHVLGNTLFAFAFAPLIASVLDKAASLDASEERAPSPARFKL